MSRRRSSSRGGAGSRRSGGIGSAGERSPGRDLRERFGYGRVSGKEVWL